MATTAASSAFELWQAREASARVLRSGCQSIDELLGGGFRSGLLTEICGEASAGKTQVCLQLLLQCCLPRELGGLEGTACYVCTEGVGAVKRLHELAGVYARRYGSVVGLGAKRKRGVKDGRGSATNENEFLDGIFVEQLYAVDDLLDMLQTRLPTLLEEQNTKLVVVDSVAAAFRLESTSSVKEASTRSRTMFQMANCMRILSAQYGVIFVLTNQVTGDFNAADQRTSTASASGAHRPALGLSWSNCINQRLMISRMPEAPLRRLEVRFSPYLGGEPPAYFEITSEGLRAAD